jgi:hypothetical protein
MKRLTGPLAVLALVAAILVVVLMQNEARFPQEARAQLDRFLAYDSVRAQRPPSVQQIVGASKPWAFTPNPGIISFGGGVHFRPDYDYDGREGVGPKPLPFPPADVWCVLLDYDSVRSGIFVALHQDLYNADWVVHTGWKRLSIEEFERLASGVGCELDNHPNNG